MTKIHSQSNFSSINNKTNIPADAKCVFKGITYDVYQWEQQMFDGTSKIFEALRRNLGVQIIAVIDNKILLQKEEQPHKGEFISLPGGCADNEKESSINVAKREFLEETGYSVKNWQLWHSQGFSARIDWNSYYYIAKNCEKVQEPQLDSGEKIESYLLTFQEFLEEIQKDSFRNHYFKNLINKIASNPKHLEKFKQQLFGEENK